MLKKYKASASQLSAQQMKALKGGISAEKDFTPQRCFDASECGTPVCSPTLQELCWMCNNHSCGFVF